MNAGLLLRGAAYCLCPPAIVAGSVATVPPVRHLVHKLSASHTPRHAVAHRASAPALAAERNARPCITDAALDTVAVSPETVNFAQALGIPGPIGPQGAGLGPVAPLTQPTTFFPATLTPQTLAPAINQPVADAVVPDAALPIGSTPATTPSTTPADALGDTGISSAPEPSVWMMMVAGFGTVGGALRFGRARRGPRLAALGAAAGSAATLPTAGLEMLQGAPALASVAARSVKMGAMAKAALCVCPMAMMATTAMVAPPVRHALHTATAPALHQRRLTAAYDATQGCDAPAPTVADDD